MPNGRVSIRPLNLSGKSVCVSKRCRRPQGPLIRVCGVSIDVYFHGGFNEIISDCVRHHRTEISLMQLEVVLAASGASDQGTKPLAAMSDIGGRIYHRPLTVVTLSARTYVIT
jgi:hypothetical protein